MLLLTATSFFFLLLISIISTFCHNLSCLKLGKFRFPLSIVNSIFFNNQISIPGNFGKKKLEILPEASYRENHILSLWKRMCHSILETYTHTHTHIHTHTHTHIYIYIYIYIYINVCILMGIWGLVCVWVYHADFYIDKKEWYMCIYTVRAQYYWKIIL